GPRVRLEGRGHAGAGRTGGQVALERLGLRPGEAASKELADLFGLRTGGLDHDDPGGEARPASTAAFYGGPGPHARNARPASPSTNATWRRYGRRRETRTSPG